MILPATIALVAIVAHTVLMAVTSEAAEPQHSDHSMGIVAAESLLDAHRHDARCFTVQASGTTRPMPLPTSIGSPLYPHSIDGRSSLAEGLVWPLRHPPNVIRALLQVYRI